MIQEQGEKNNIFQRIKVAYRRYKSDVDFVKNKNKFWKQKPYRWGLTHISIANHAIYWEIIKSK